MISLVGSNQKRFAKSTCISTRFHRWIQPDFKVACLLRSRHMARNVVDLEFKTSPDVEIHIINY